MSRSHLDTVSIALTPYLSPSSIVVERAVELGFISSVIDLIATGYSFFVEGSLSPEVATASATVAAIGAAFQYYIRAV